MITEISIANFRGIREGKLTGLTQVNILAGRNATGKSTVLEAVMLASHPHGHEVDRLGDSWWRQVFYRRTGGREAPSELYYNFGRSNPQFELVYEDGTSFKTEYIVGAEKWDSFSEERRKALQDVTLVDCDLMRKFTKIEGTLWDEIDRLGKELQIREALKKVYGLDNLYNIQFTRSQEQYKLGLKMDGRVFPVDVLADGVKYALAILTVAVGMEDTALLLEEPEAHQHPEALRLMLMGLFDMAKQNRLQLFMSTHSLELIVYALEAAKNKELDLKVYHLMLSQDGVLSARGIAAPDAKVLSDIGFDPRTLQKYALLSSE